MVQMQRDLATEKKKCSSQVSLPLLTASKWPGTSVGQPAFQCPSVQAWFSAHMRRSSQWVTNAWRHGRKHAEGERAQLWGEHPARNIKDISMLQIRVTKIFRHKRERMMFPGRNWQDVCKSEPGRSSGPLPGVLGPDAIPSLACWKLHAEALPGSYIFQNLGACQDPELTGNLPTLGLP